MVYLAIFNGVFRSCHTISSFLGQPYFVALALLQVWFNWRGQWPRRSVVSQPSPSPSPCLERWPAAFAPGIGRHIICSTQVLRPFITQEYHGNK